MRAIGIVVACAIFSLAPILAPILAPAGLPSVDSPYNGEFCIDPATDGDLEMCYGLPWYVTLEATAIFLED